MGHCCFYSIEIFVVDYAIYHCLLHMIYVLGLAISSKLCRGVYAVMLFTPLHIIITNDNEFIFQFTLYTYTTQYNI